VGILGGVRFNEKGLDFTQNYCITTGGLLGKNSNALDKIEEYQDALTSSLD
jgi:hypothetical protein